MSLIPVVHLDLQISLRILEKIRNGQNGILCGWGETAVSWKKTQKQQILWHCPFKTETAGLLRLKVCRFDQLVAQLEERRADLLRQLNHRLQTKRDKLGKWNWRNRVNKYLANFSYVNLLFNSSESIVTLPPFGHIEGHKWFFQISSQWESQKNRFAFISFGKIQFYFPAFVIYRSYLPPQVIIWV